MRGDLISLGIIRHTSQSLFLLLAKTSRPVECLRTRRSLLRSQHRPRAAAAGAFSRTRFSSLLMAFIAARRYRGPKEGLALGLLKMPRHSREGQSECDREPLAHHPDAGRGDLVRNGDNISMLTPGDKEALQGTSGAAGGHGGHLCLVDTDAMWVLCFLQSIFISTSFQQMPRTQSLSYHCKNVLLASGRKGTYITRAREGDDGQFCRVPATCAGGEAGSSPQCYNSPRAPGPDPDCERQERSSCSEWAIMKLKSLKLHDIFLHYFFHPGAIPCRCSPAAPGHLSSRPRPFPLRHFAFTSLQESGS